MEEKQFTKEEIVLILKEQAEGTEPLDICIRHGISDDTLLEWQAAYGSNLVARGNSLRKFMHQVFRPGFTRRELLFAGAAGMAGFSPNKNATR